MKKTIYILVALGLALSTNEVHAKKTKTVKLNESEQMFWSKQEKRIKAVTSADRKAMPYLTISEYSKLTLVEQVRYVKLLRHSLSLANKLQTQFYKKQNKRVISSLWWLTGHEATAHIPDGGEYKYDHVHDQSDIPAPGIHGDKNFKDLSTNEPSVYRSSINEPFRRDKGDYAIVYGRLCSYKSKKSVSNSCGYSQTSKDSPCKNKGGRACGYLTGLSSYNGSHTNVCTGRAPRHANGTETCVAKAYSLTKKQEKQADAVYSYIKDQLRDFKSASSKKSRGTTDCNTRFASASYEEWDACRNGRNTTEEPDLDKLKKLVESLKHENLQNIVIGKDSDGENILFKESGLSLGNLRVDPRIDATLLYLAAINNEVTGEDISKHNELLKLIGGTGNKNGALITTLNKGKVYNETIDSHTSKGAASYHHIGSTLDEYNKGVQIFDQIFEGTIQHCSRGVAEDLKTFADVDKKQNPRVKDLSFQAKDCQALVGSGCPEFSCDKYTTSNGNAAPRLCSVKDALVKLNNELVQGCEGRHLVKENYRAPRVIYKAPNAAGTSTAQ